MTTNQMTQSRKARSPRGDFEQSKQVATSIIEERLEAQRKKTERLRALRTAGQEGAENRNG